MRSLLFVAAAVWLVAVGVAQADGALTINGRTLQREGSETRDPCATEGDACRNALLRVLSGYAYLPGSLALGTRVTGGRDTTVRAQPALDLRLSTIGAATPSGELNVGSAALAATLEPAAMRLRGSAFDARALFFCRDSQRGGLHAPMFGVMTRACAPHAVVALEFGLVDAQWDPAEHRTAVEWLRTGLGFELLANGHAHSRLQRSVYLAPLVDLRSLRYGETSPTDAPEGRFGVGTGARLGTLWRSARWETGLDARYRVDLLQLDAPAPDHQLALELRALYSFFLTDAIVAQLGLRAGYHYASAQLDAFGMQASTSANHSGFVGAVLGWKHEPPPI